MKWWLECKISGVGEQFVGSLNEAIARAKALCSDDGVRWCVWNERNVKIAEVDCNNTWKAIAIP